ncbi:hypothetical protein [Agromyces binzhouensis]|uniref:hypothetical protein n=1 Tax=Agromyces binzhouensis TaxID=1817495 RepID=UPI003635A8BE
MPDRPAALDALTPRRAGAIVALIELAWARLDDGRLPSDVSEADALALLGARRLADLEHVGLIERIDGRVTLSLNAIDAALDDTPGGGEVR